MTMKELKKNFQIGELEVRFILEGKDTDNKVLLFESVFPAGAKVGMPPHYHQHIDEVIYVLDGVLTVTLDGKKMEIGAGEGCFVPKGVTHQITNNSGELVKGLGLMTPALIGINYFKEMSALLDTATIPDTKKIREVMLRNDTVPVIPQQNTAMIASHENSQLINEINEHKIKEGELEGKTK